MNSSTFYIIGGVIIVAVIFVFFQQQFAPNNSTAGIDGLGEFDLGQDNVVSDQGIIDDSNAGVTDIVDEINTVDQPTGNIGETLISTRTIQVTDGVKHTVPLDEIIGGGPPRDGIPSIDNPKFVSIKQAAKDITDQEPGIAVSLNGVDRFYPFQILVWHEIVNDKFNGQRVLVTYCPLCLSGIVFDPVIQGQRVEFGTSGKLWKSNLVMYDRKTETLWSQVLGEAIAGELTGQQLAVLPSDQIRFGDWRRQHPNGEVLSRDTGASRSYGSDPYGSYYTTEGTYFAVGAPDDRLKQKDFVLGVVINGQAKAYWPPAVKEKKQVLDVVGGMPIVAVYIEDIDAVRIFESTNDGKLGRRINPFGNFWFSWVAAHPETGLFK